MTIAAVALAGAVVAEGAGVLKAGTDLAIGGTGNYIATGNAFGLIPSAGLEFARATCRRYGANPGGVSEAASLNYEKACRPYLDANGFGSGPTLNGPLPGGCAGQSYNFYTESRTASTGWRERSPVVVFGPVTDRRIVQTGTSPLQTTWFIDGRNSAGQPITVTTFTGVSIGNARWGRVTTNPPGGNPYACSDGPPVIEQPIPDPNPVPPRFPIVIQPSFDVDFQINIAPNGTVNVIAPDINISIDPFADSSSSDGGGGGGRPPGDVGTPGLPSGTGDAGETEGEAPPGKVLIGLRLNYTTEPPKWAEVAPDVFRAPCYVYMGTESGLDMDFAGSLVKDNQFIFAEKENLTRWKVVANRGFRLTATPFYGDPV